MKKNIRIVVAVPFLDMRGIYLKAFSGTGVAVTAGDLLDVAADTVVSPANSHGYMDGGLDEVYRKRFGEELEKRLLGVVESLGGAISVGRAVTIPVPGNHSVRRIIFAPTMEMPEAIPAVNVFRATLAALKELDRFNAGASDTDKIRELWFPALGTGVGQVDPREAATEMRLAWDRWMEGP